MRLLTSERKDLADKIESTSNVNVRYRDSLFGGRIIIDSQEDLLVLRSGGVRTGIWSDEIGIAKFAKEYFEYLWNESKRVCNLV